MDKSYAVQSSDIPSASIQKECKIKKNVRILKSWKECWDTWLGPIGSSWTCINIGQLSNLCGWVVSKQQSGKLSLPSPCLDFERLDETGGVEMMFWGALGTIPWRETTLIWPVFIRAALLSMLCPRDQRKILGTPVKTIWLSDFWSSLQL